MTVAQNVFITELKGFANPVIARRLAAAGARVIGCDPGITADGDAEGVEAIAWAKPAELVARATDRFGGRLDAIVISSAMPAPRIRIEDLTEETLMPYFQRLATESLLFAGAAVKAMRPNRSVTRIASDACCTAADRRRNCDSCRVRSAAAAGSARRACTLSVTSIITPCRMLRSLPGGRVRCAMSS